MVMVVVIVEVMVEVMAVVVVVGGGLRLTMLGCRFYTNFFQSLCSAECFNRA
jgi:hypothetical protein